MRRVSVEEFHASVQIALEKARSTPSGPGTELKSILKIIGISSGPNCSCDKRAQIMDEKGCDWCEEHIGDIDIWLAEEAKKRKLPYVSLAGKKIISLAIQRARKKTHHINSISPRID